MSTTFETTKYLCASSCFIGISSLVLFKLKKYFLSFLFGVLCITSLNHWRDYQAGSWRQRIDLAWVNVCGFYGIFESLLFGTEFQQCIFLSVTYCNWIFYKISEKGTKHWPIFHMTIHMYASFFIPLMYLL
jgi:hypothetical protein